MFIALNELPSSNPVNSLYGIAYDIHIDPVYIKAGTIKFTHISSWLCNPASNALSLSKIFQSNGDIENAIIRTDHIDQSGYGKIGELRFVVNPAIASIDSMHVSISYYNAVNETGQPVTFTVKDTSIIVFPITTSLNEISSQYFSIYPNPAINNITINAGDLQSTICDFRIYDVVGNLVLEKSFNNKTSLDVSTFPSGVYFIKVISEKGIEVRKFIKE